MTELVGSPDIRPELRETLNFAERIMRDEDYGLPDDPGSFDPSETFSGPLYDLNDPATTPQEEAYLRSWIERQLGHPIPTAPVKTRYISADQTTKVAIYDVRFRSNEDRWFLSEWQQEGEGQRPYYVLWQEEMYDALEFEGYESVE